jgi:6,7-dimethyl-8-ribityllumazine synthase
MSPQIHTIEANINPKNISRPLAIVISRFNEPIVTQLLKGAVQCLTRLGVEEQKLKVIWVPGAFEIPYICQKLAKQDQFDGILTLGAVIRGETPHFDYVAGEAAKGVAQVSLKYDIPISFGVLTCDTIDQAWTRAGVKGGNKGEETAISLLEMIQLGYQIQKDQ